MKMPESDVADRLSILILKWIHGLDVKNELLKYSKDFKLTEDFFDLLKTNYEVWQLESAIRNGSDLNISLEEIGRRALRIRDINRERIQIKNRIAKLKNEFQEEKIEHLSRRNNVIS